MFSVRLNSLLVALLAAAVLAACGGGGGGISLPPDVDVTAPEVVATLPAAGAADVSLNQSLAITFSEALAAASVTPASVQVSVGGSPVAAYGVELSGRVILVRPPAGGWPLSSTLLVVVAGITDPAGNAFADPLDLVPFSFTTSDGTSDLDPPLIAATVPADATSAVPLAQVVTITFNEPLDASTVTSGAVVLRDAVRAVPGSVALSTDATVVSFTPSLPLAPNVTYALTVAASVADLAGNPLAGAQETSFATVSAGWRGTFQFGTTGTDKVQALTTDASGHFYVTGYTSGVFPGKTSAGGDDVFLAKYDPTGLLVWREQFGTPAFDGGRDLVVDPHGNVFVVGFYGTTTAFLAKYDANGQRAWLRTLASSATVDAYGLAVAGTGEIYVCGITNGALPGTLFPQGFAAFLARYDAAGSLVWTRLLDSPGYDDAAGVALDGAGHVYLAGEYEGDLLSTSTGKAYLARYSTAGVPQELALLNSTLAPGREFHWALAYDPRSDSVVTTGITHGRLTDDPLADLAPDLFVAEFDATTLVPTGFGLRQIGSAAYDEPFGLALDGAGDLYLAGQTKGALLGLELDGSGQAFLLKLARATGAPLAIIAMDAVGEDSGIDVALLPDGDPLLAGITKGNIGGTNPAPGTSDAFVSRHDPLDLSERVAAP